MLSLNNTIAADVCVTGNNSEKSRANGANEVFNVVDLALNPRPIIDTDVRSAKRHFSSLESVLGQTQNLNE